MKRFFDMFFSAMGLAVLAPLFALVSLLIKLDGPGPVFFRQERIGKNFRPFRIYKFRTMKDGAHVKGPLVTVSGDDRITPIGRTLRKYKIDELPQLINVIKGEMSLVGPRPEVKKYVELFRAEYGKLLMLPPGITDAASISYSAEEGVLSRSGDKWEEVYVKKVLPEKLRLSLQYAGRHNLLTDLRIILATLLKIAHIKKSM